ncbi:hypothetical protein RIF29_24676 [Crotalaria pallida]|uniref:STAR protein homodimerisation region domain-containing protein n=1 Tax=Crotalaria pallida TaxID=3830 RepID=A0AAN9EQC5_CROPI
MQSISELLVEHQKIGPFTQVLPICNRLLNQEINLITLQQDKSEAAAAFANDEVCVDPRFKSSRLSLLDLDFIYVKAHIRGGCELGGGGMRMGSFEEKEYFHFIYSFSGIFD